MIIVLVFLPVFGIITLLFVHAKDGRLDLIMTLLKWLVPNLLLFQLIFIVMMAGIHNKQLAIIILSLFVYMIQYLVMLRPISKEYKKIGN